MTGIIVLIIYALIMVGATILMTNKERNMERFCVGDRNIGWFVSALSIAATWIWAPALFTSTENAYTKGFAGFMSDLIHTFCKKNKSRNATWHHIVRIYVCEV